MATAIYPLTLLQAGMESTKGTRVAATKKLPGDHQFVEEQDFYRSPFPAGVRANVGGAGVITRKGYTVDYSSDLTAEDILWLLETGIRGGVTPSTVDTNARLWTYTPELTTGVPTIRTATLECVHSDGATNHYVAEIGYAMTESIKIDFAFNQEAKLSAKLFGRARQSDTPTPSLSPNTREPLLANLLQVFLDTTYAGLGTTQLTSVVRSGSIDVSTGYAPNYTVDGRDDKDFVNHKVGLLQIKASVVLELDATGAARIANFRANDVVYVRHQFNGGQVIGASTAKRFVRVDSGYRFTSSPSFSRDGEQWLVNIDLESVNTAAEPPVFAAQSLLTTV